MGRQNIVFLYGRVSRPPMARGEGENRFGMVYVETVRGFREVDDKISYVKHDHPLIMSRNPAVIDQVMEWKENDTVFIKGVITSKTINKGTFCPDCTDDGTGKPTRNDVKGNLVYVTPIFVEKAGSFDDKAAANDDVYKHREISNQCYVLGTLIRDPKMFTTKGGVRITQYPIAINRKFTIRTDDPKIRTDWPIVKSYGEQALDDKTYLQYQADVIVDGFLQARTLTRKVKCRKCGKVYPYADHCMELVPYDVEYVRGYLSDDDVERVHHMSAEDVKQMLYNSGHSDELDEELSSDDVSGKAAGT